MYKIGNQIYFITFCYLDTFFDHNRQVWAMSNQLLVCTSRRDFSLSILSTFIKSLLFDISKNIQKWWENSKLIIWNETWKKKSWKLGTDLPVPPETGPDDRGTKGGLAGFLRAAQCFSKFRGGALRFSLTASRSLSARVTRVYHSRPLPVISIIPLSFPFVHRIAHEEARKERGVSGTLKLDL